MFSRLTAGTGVVIALGSKAFDLVGLGTDEVVRFGVGLEPDKIPLMAKTAGQPLFLYLLLQNVPFR